MLILIPFLTTGNPTTEFRVNRAAGDLVAGDAILDHVKYTSCSGNGSAFVNVGQSLDVVQGFSVSTPIGNWCSITLYWEGSMTLDANDYGLSYDNPVTTLQIAADGSVAPVDLNPFTVLYGQFPGGGSPKLYATIH